MLEAADPEAHVCVEQTEQTDAATRLAPRRFFAPVLAGGTVLWALLLVLSQGSSRLHHDRYNINKLP